MTAVLICDDRRGVCEGLARAMSAVPGVRRIDCVAYDDELLATYFRQPADLVLVGTQQGTGIGAEVTRRLSAAHPRADIIVFGPAEDVTGIAAAIAGGARGYLRWESSGAEVTNVLADRLTGEAAIPRPSEAGLKVQLTERELQVLACMSQGKSNGRIGHELFLSEDTVKTHARRLFRKLGAKDRAQAVAHGFRYGLVT